MADYPKIITVLLSIYFVPVFTSVPGSADIVHSNGAAVEVTTTAITTGVQNSNISLATIEKNTNQTSTEVTDVIHNIRPADKITVYSSGENLTDEKAVFFNQVSSTTTDVDLAANDTGLVYCGNETSSLEICRRMGLSASNEMDAPLSEVSPDNAEVKALTTEGSSPSMNEVSQEVTLENIKGNTLPTLVHSSTSKNETLLLQAALNSTNGKLLSVGVSSSTSMDNVLPAEEGPTTSKTNPPPLETELTTSKYDSLSSEVSFTTGLNSSQSLEINLRTTTPNEPSLEGNSSATKKNNQSSGLSTVRKDNESNDRNTPKTSALPLALIVIIIVASLVLIEVGLMNLINWWKDNERDPGSNLQRVFNFFGRNLTNRKMGGVEFTDPLVDTSSLFEEVA